MTVPMPFLLIKQAAFPASSNVETLIPEITDASVSLGCEDVDLLPGGHPELGTAEQAQDLV